MTLSYPILARAVLGFVSVREPFGFGVGSGGPGGLGTGACFHRSFDQCVRMFVR
jgi:hypothetical protein